MTLSTIVLVASMSVLAGGRTQVPAATTPAAPSFALEMGLRIMHGDALVAKATTGSGDTVSGSVWTDLVGCSSGAGDREPGVDRVRWRISGRIVQRSADAFVVEAEWQRIGDGTGRSFDGAKSTQQLTIHPGERAALDEVALPGSPCPATSAKLEAAIVLSDVSRVTSVAGGRGVSGGGGGGAQTGVSGWVGAGVSNGAGHFGITAADMVRSMTRVTTGVISGVTMGPGGAIAGAGPRVEIRPVTSGSYDAEAWLVHTPPTGGLNTWRTLIHVSASGETFSFAPIDVPTPAGIANVDIAVMLRPVTTTDGLLLLHVVVARRVSGAADTLGSSAKFIPIPGPGDVVSFEMPPAGRPGQDPTPGNQFSVRIRLAPGRVD